MFAGLPTDAMQTTEVLALHDGQGDFLKPPIFK